MKKKIHILILLMLGMSAFFHFSLFSQDISDTVITISIENFIYDDQEKYAEFDIYLTRSNDNWQYWENATFQLFLYDMFGSQINYKDFSTNVIYASSEVMLSAGAAIYQIDSKILDDRLMIICTHQDTTYTDLPLFGKNQKLRLCKLRINRHDDTFTSFPVSVAWATPIDYYQAIAYKYVSDIDYKPEYMFDAGDADNIEMAGAGTGSARRGVNYLVTTTVPPTMALDYFTARYSGNLNVILEYATYSEHKNKGFIIKRALSPEGAIEYDSISDDYFTELVADYRDEKFTERMEGLYNSSIGKIYDPIVDKIDYRTVTYIYRLYYQKDENDTIIRLATTELKTPNFLLVKAEASPNPFKGKTKVRYVLEDDVYMTCEVFDALGRKIKNLVDFENGILDRKFVRLGEHFAEFEAPELANQGLYEVVFTAYPINDPYLEIARASLKVQYIKD